MSIYLITGKGNISNNFPYAYSRNKERASIYAKELKKERQNIRVQKCTDITLLALMEKYFIVNLDK